MLVDSRTQLLHNPAALSSDGDATDTVRSAAFHNAAVRNWIVVYLVDLGTALLCLAVEIFLLKSSSANLNVTDLRR